MSDRPKRKALSKKTRFDVFKRDFFTCQYCGAHPPGILLHVDHVVAVANGGSNSIDNLVTSCEPCNAGKGARSLAVVPQALSDKAKKVAEREAQLLGYQEILQEKRDRLDEETWRVIRILEGDDCDSYPTRDFQSVRMFVDRIGLHATMESADYTTLRNVRRPFKYFCGVCWSKVKELANAG